MTKETTRDRLVRKEQRNSPGSGFNNALARAHTGQPPNGCLSFIITVIIIFLLFRACM
ncbi:DUF6366 family protein [Evansella cellulosilytica]|uniref:DUF6366 family protein n=1 Tax=Evansella cellulosilytica TaxID=1413 RepID=UPI0001C28FA0|nr:hypothetical protein [Evansella cellulosilytica]